MSYRINEPKPQPPRRTMQKTATPHKIYMHSGETVSLAIPCWYLEVRPPVPAHPHNRQLHDHLGWPGPDHPDHCCQDWDFARSCCSLHPHKPCDPGTCKRYLDMGRLVPIHLQEEGYAGFECHIVRIGEDGYQSDDDPALTVDLIGVDRADDWVIRLVLAHNPTEDLDYPHKDNEERYFITVRGSRPSTISTESGGAGKSPIKDVLAVGEVIILPVAYTPLPN